MRVLLKAYTQLNVGDDLFIDIIARRYPRAEFMLAGETNGRYALFAAARANLREFCGHTLFYRAARRLGRVPFAEKSILRASDAVVYIGGSIFMENTKDRYLENAMLAETEYCAKRKIPYHILSCNFGPYKTEKYKERMRTCFERCAEVCFRDRVSYDMFSDMPNVRCAPDAVFSFDMEKPQVRGDVLGVVPISYENRAEGAEYGKRYIKTAAEYIRRHLEDGGRAEIFCFCAFEGDADAAEAIIAELGDMGGSVSVRVYDGELYDFLKEYLSCGRIFASRFHAIMLAIMYGIPLIPHIYSKKTENVLRDMGIYGEIDFEHFRQYSIGESYVENSQKIWENFDELYKIF